jgi:Xaa-Pro dipeptidase
MNHKNRINKLFNSLEKKTDAVLINNYVEPYLDDNFFYFTGLEEGIYENCSAILYKDKQSELIISELEYESTSNSIDNINIYKNRKIYENILKENLSSLKNIGLNYDNFLFKDYIKLQKLFPKIEFIDISKEISNLRIIKGVQEINRIRKACKIVDKVMEKIPNIIYKGITENLLAAEIDYLMQKNGANKAAFTTISSFGQNTSKPHYSHGSIKIKEGDLIICDFGANYKKYNSDVTRTFVFGKSDKFQEKMYKTIINAQKIAFDEIKINVKAKEIHNKVYNYIEKTEFKSLFIHSTGHSLGLNVHDLGGGISADSNILLKENMIFTIEPGIYIPNYGGIRIEDDILVNKNGFELLTRSSRDFIEI